MKKGNQDKTLSTFILLLKQIPLETKAWILRGEKPPSNYKRSLALIAFLLFFGFSCLIFALLEYFQILTIYLPTLVPFFGISFLTLTPGLYMAWIAICSWRRVPGYGWWMIPNIDY